jgi:hypothetical protein
MFALIKLLVVLTVSATLAVGIPGAIARLS